MVARIVEINVVIIELFEFLIDTVEPPQVLRAHHNVLPATLTRLSCLTQHDHRVYPPRLVHVRKDLGDAPECTLLLVLFILITVFALPGRPTHIVIFNCLRGDTGLEVLFLQLIMLY